jgi:hypothetical protein
MFTNGEGKRQQYLLMQNECDFYIPLILSGSLTVADAFQRLSGKNPENADVILHVEYLDKPSEF